VAELYSLGTHQSTASIEYGLLLDEITNQVRDLEEVNFNTEHALKWVNTYRFRKERFNAELAGYLNYIFNYIYLKPRGVTQNSRGIFPYFRYTQTDASFLGADISLSYQILKSLSMSGHASLLRASDVTNDDYLIFIPSNRYDVSIRHQQAEAGTWTNFFVEAKVKYVDKQNRAPRVVPISEIIEAKEQGIDLFENDNRNFDFVDSPEAYFLVSFSSGITRPIGKTAMEIRITADNLTNSSYREYANRMRYYADDLGRNISIALKFSF
jgi:iron complex outermembrane receptor protein